MVNAQTLKGSWNEVKGRLRTRWSQLSGDELGAFDGNVDQLVGLIQRKTGEARTAIEGVENAQDMVQRRPIESAAICFGSGLLAGVIIGLCMRSR
jgi:uncharacterized protein YjbJ (UPF0337 family)